MADKETGLNIPVSAVADKNSAKEAVNELTKDVLSSLKDGYIEIPAELKVPIKGASKDLEKAQKDVIKQWERTFKEGFSSSAKDLDNLTAAYQRFKKLAGQQHKANTKQSRGISAIMGGPIQEYSMSKREAQTTGKEIKKEIEKAQKRNTKQSLTAEKRKLINDVVKQNNKNKGYDKLSKELRRGTSRAKGSTPGADINLGLRRPSMGGPYVDAKSFRMSEISPYRSVDEARRAKEQQKIRARERASLTSRRATSEDINEADKKLKQREAGGRSQSGTEYELIKRALLTELAKIQGGLIKGKPDATSQKLIDQVFANLAYDEDQGIDPLKSIMGIHNMLQKRYDTKGKIGITDGTTKGEGPNQKEANEILSQIYKILGRFIEARQSIVDNVLDIKSALLGGKATSSKSSLYTQELNRIQGSEQFETLKSALEPITDNTEAIKIQNIREIGRQSMADQAAGRTSRNSLNIATEALGVARDDANTGLNSENRTKDLIDSIKENQDAVSILEEIRDILQQISSGDIGEGKGEVADKTDQEKIDNLPDLHRQFVDGKWTVSGVIDKTDYTEQRVQLPTQQQWEKIFEKQRISAEKQRTTINDPAVVAKIEKELEEINKGTHELQQRTFLEPSDISTSQKGFLGTLRKVFKDFLPETEVERIMNANAKEQARMRAERIETYGLNRGRQLTDTGDIADVKRTKSLFGWIYRNDEKNKALFQDVKLTPGFTGENRIDTTDIMNSLNKVLSGPEMFKAQTGGTLRNIIGSMTGYIGMPSIEKSRTQAEGLNQVMANVRTEVLGLIQDLQAKEATLIGMQEKGTIKFTKEGYPAAGSSLAAQNVFLKMEEQKQVLRSALAEVAMIDDIIGKTGGKVSKIIKNLGFVMPELMQNNTIIQNINAGLDKNGKALKFQTRLAEILNYSFQLMSRYIGQILKNWLWMINPLNLIKQRFNDFASYDSKWQRTMNVIRYNLRDVIRPFMEWIAQQLVNIIGFLDIISMKIQEAFGYTPISLFDQKNADEFKKTYESITDISASFDELHDIGSSSGENDPNNLLGDIYKPQLSQGWIDLANQIGDLFAGVIKGDLGFGEVMIEILKIAGGGIKTLWSEIIWPFIKDTIWPGVKDNVLEILAWILGAFIAWKGLKLIGSLLWNAISGAFVKGSGTSLLKRMFTNANGVVGIGKNIGTLITGGILTVISTMALADAINDAWTQGKSDANTGQGMNLTDQQTGMDALQGALGGAGAVLGGGMIAAALGASVALGPLLAVAAGVAALAAVVVVGAEAWAYHSQQNKIANNEMLEASDYAEQAAATQEKLKEVTDMVNNGLEIKNTHQEKLNQLEEEYGISLDYVNQKVAAAGGNTSVLTEKEKALYEQGKLTQESIENYNRLLEIQIELQKQQLWQKEQEAIALDMEAGHYELAALRIEQAELQGLITTEEATAKRIQLYKTCGEEERANLLQNLTPEQRTLMLQYTNATEEELSELAKIWDESSQDVKNALLDGVGPDVVSAFDRRMNDIDRVVKEHTGFWEGVGDTLKEIFSFSMYDSWTYNGQERYYKEGYDTKWVASEIQAIQNDNTLSEEEKRRRIQNIRNMASFAVGTNYVPNDGLAYLHQGEAVIPKKYNQPYQPMGMSPEEQLYMRQMISTMKSLDNTMKQGIPVSGQFVQRGSDLVAVVNKTKAQTGADLLSNVSYAR